MDEAIYLLDGDKIILADDRPCCLMLSTICGSSCEVKVQTGSTSTFLCRHRQIGVGVASPIEMKPVR